VCVGREKKEWWENGTEEGAEKGGGDIKTLRVHLDSSSSLSSFSGMTIHTNLPSYLHTIYLSPFSRFADTSILAFFFFLRVGLPFCF